MHRLVLIASQHSLPLSLSAFSSAVSAVPSSARTHELTASQPGNRCDGKVTGYQQTTASEHNLEKQTDANAPLLPPAGSLLRWICTALRRLVDVISGSTLPATDSRAQMHVAIHGMNRNLRYSMGKSSSFNTVRLVRMNCRNATCKPYSDEQ